MKLTAGKRIMMFFHWLLSLLICAAFTAYLIRPEWVMTLYNRVTIGLNANQIMIIGIAILAVYVILAVIQICIIFHRGKHSDRGFITVDSSDNGRVRIAVSAIEQMVRQSVISIDGITEMKISIESDDDAIRIIIAAILMGGCHVPTVTMNMQRSIRQFVEMNCGVAVRSVSININSVAAPDTKGRWGRKPHAEIPPTPVTPLVAPAAPVEPEPEVAAPEETRAAAPAVEPIGATEPETAETAESEPIRLRFDHLDENGEPIQFDKGADEGDDEAPRSASGEE